MYNRGERYLPRNMAGALVSSASVIWLHGLGADGHDFEPIVPELRLPASLPLRFVFPHAPLRPVTLNNGYVMRAWFDIVKIGLNQPRDRAGIMAMSTYLPLVEGFEFQLNPANAATPIFYGHGTQDPVVPLQLAEHTRNELIARGCPVTWHTYPMPHAVHPEEILHIRAWLLSVLPVMG